MKVRVEVDGKTEEVDIDVESLMLQEAVEVQGIIGDAHWDDLADGVMRPDALQAVLYVKLHRDHPDVKIDDFDFTFEQGTSPSDPT